VKSIATIIVILVTLSPSMNLFGQISNFDRISKDILDHLKMMGTDSSFFLNGYESDYFNALYAETRKDFDFTGKKIGFITGSNGKTLSSKKEYFIKEYNRFKNNESPNDGQLYVFSTIQKEESGGYDAVIVYWCKVLLRVEDLPKKLKSI